MVAEMVDAVVAADGDRLARVLAPWPALAQHAAGLVVDPQLEGRLLALWELSSQIRTAGDLILAGRLAVRIVAALCRAGAADPRAPERHRSLLASVTTYAATTLTDAGLARETLAEADGWLAALRAAGQSDQRTELKLTLAEAATMIGPYEKAAAWLQEFASEHPAPARNPTYLRLTDKLDGLLRAVDQEERDDTDRATILEQSAKALAEGAPEFQSVFGPLLARPPEAGDEALTAWGIAFETAAATFGFPTPREGMAETAAAVDAVDTSGSPRFLLHRIFGSCSRLFGAIGRDDQEAYAALAGLARRAQLKAQAFEQWEESQSLGWLAAICLRRAGHQAAAAGILRELRDSLRRRQLAIRAPRLRAALAVHLPYLAGSSADTLFSLGEPAVAELFEAIEGAKSGILVDLIEERRGLSPAAPLAAVQRLLQSDAQRVCYCTFLIGHPPGVDPAPDDTATYAVLVAPEGPPVATRLALGRSALAAAVEELRRLNEGGVREGAFDWASAGPIPVGSPWERPYDEVLSLLRPLAAWLEHLMQANVLRQDDVLCLSLDGPLFGLPVQALDIAGAPLGVRFACTIVPSAGVLLACAAARKAAVPRRPVAVVAPLASEDPQKARQNLETLAGHGEVELLGGPAADLARVEAATLSGALIHVAAHGVFDAKAPLQSSGVVLPRDGAYPPGKRARAGTLLSPDALARLDLDGSHISFRACVSGRTTEVTSREALGMIWAAFSAGATSILAGQWDVHVPSAAAVLDEFYRAAATESFASAYRQALERVRAQSRAYGHPYHFCGLAYYGYWR